MAAISITVATPAFGEMFYTPYVQSILRLHDIIHQRNWVMQHTTISHAHINEARNFLLTRWFDKSDATHLLFVDADMGFEPQLILDMIEFDKPVVGVIYTKRQVDLERLANLAAKGEKPERAIARAHDFIVRPLPGRQPRRIKGFIEVAGCGTGIMLIKRSTIATMLKTLPDISEPTAKDPSQLATGLNRVIRAFNNITVDGVLLVNDFAFCHRWQALCKGELWACADRSVIHVGLHRFSSSYADAGFGKPRITVALGTQSTRDSKLARATHKTGNGPIAAQSREKPKPSSGANKK